MKRIAGVPAGILTVASLVAVLGCGQQESSAPQPAQPAAKAENATPAAEKPVAGQPALTPERPALGQPTPPDSPLAAAPTATPAPKPEPEPEPAAEEKEVDLGPPLVENASQLVRLDPKYPVFIDKQHKRVVMVGQVCQRQVPLEMFACIKNTKEHEAIVTLPTKAMIVHAALLAVGAEPGEPAHFDPFTPAHGQEVTVEVLWKDAKGQIQRKPAQEWIKNANTGKALDKSWIFAGSGFWTDPSTGEKHYQAESGDLICVSNFSSATLDVDQKSSSSNDSLVFEAFTERIPPKGTPVTLLLTPQPRKK
jgi:hypothetical protein